MGSPPVSSGSVRWRSSPSRSRLVFINDQERATTAAMLTAALAGVCFGFLPHNFFPARMFMGDSGSLLIGFMLACSTISLTGQFSTLGIDQGVDGSDASLLPALLPVILPFAVLMVPFLDLVLAVVRRTREGRSPFSPDKRHLHHRLLEIGHSQRRAVVVMYLWAALVAFGVVVISLFSGWWSFLGCRDGDRHPVAHLRCPGHPASSTRRAPADGLGVARSQRRRVPAPSEAIPRCGACVNRSAASRASPCTTSDAACRGVAARLRLAAAAGSRLGVAVNGVETKLREGTRLAASQLALGTDFVLIFTSTFLAYLQGARAVARSNN